MKRVFIVLMVLLSMVAAAVWTAHKASANAGALNQPSYTPDGKLTLPANYRDWVFLTSGFGMNYSNGTNSNPMFTNVYVSPEAYQGFKAKAKWPDKSMFIVEIYSPASHGSINKSGHYQDSFMGLDVEVRDSSRPEEWSYYNFEPGHNTGESVGPGCNNCHTRNAAVEHTFVQFYPTLLDFAIEKNLIKPGVDIPLNQSRLMKIMDSSGWEKAEQAFYDDRKKNPDSDMLGEHVLNMMGYGLLQQKKTDRAISVFELVAKNFPDSANAYDSLADAYAAASKPQQAIAASQKEISVAQNDSNLSAEQKKQFVEMAQKRIAENQKH
ncbi:MAG TPA: cytochrome P460 family protein [Candidatus Angelobacter sp.]|nr:cytochrome P460 family protein [Candidatus Angelobacter sp.]